MALEILPRIKLLDGFDDFMWNAVIVLGQCLDLVIHLKKFGQFVFEPLEERLGEAQWL